MIASTPNALVVTLVAISLLALVIGYCLALLRTKKKVRHLIDDMRDEWVNGQSINSSDLQSAEDEIRNLNNALREQTQKAQKVAQREQALDTHAQLQAQRIQTLEAQCAAFEEQQIRLQRDFATYKSSRHRELEVARHSHDTAAENTELPVLSRKADTVATKDEHSTAAPLFVRKSAARNSGDRARASLSMPLSRELEIPSMSEADLPDSVDDLEFELADSDASGVIKRG